MKSPIRTKFDILACIPTLNNTTKSYSQRVTASGTSRSSQIGVLWVWAHGAAGCS